MNITNKITLVFLSCILSTPQITAHESTIDSTAFTETEYSIKSSGTRKFVWKTAQGSGWIKVLLDATTLPNEKIEITEVFFPYGWESKSHVHELEIFYVIEGELDHIVNGKNHILKPGMIGIVRAPDTVIHRARSKNGAKTLLIWPHGNEVEKLQKNFREMPLK